MEWNGRGADAGGERPGSPCRMLGSSSSDRPFRRRRRRWEVPVPVFPFVAVTVAGAVVPYHPRGFRHHCLYWDLDRKSVV